MEQCVPGPFPLEEGPEEEARLPSVIQLTSMDYAELPVFVPQFL